MTMTRLGNIDNIRNSRIRKAQDRAARLAVLEINETYGAASAALAVAQDRDTCRWPVGTVGDADFHFCRAPRERAEIPFIADDLPYCSAHRVRAVNAHAVKPIGEIVGRAR